VAQPRDSDPVSDREAAGRCSGLDHFSDDFVPRSDVFAVNREVALGDVQIGPADSAGTHRDQQFR
jgi:hypothetical protein